MPEAFFSCDWGTSSFRLRLIDLPRGTIIDDIRDPTGVRLIHEASLRTDAVEVSVRRAGLFASFLRGQLLVLCERNHLPAVCYPVVVSGMASSSIGWKNLPYAAVPFPLDGSGHVSALVNLDCPDGSRFTVHLLSGVRTADDVMRGEETEVMGLCADRDLPGPNWEGLMILPGTHSKHVQISQGAIQAFQTYMTGELYELLARNSVLSASVDPHPSPAGETELRGEQRLAFLDGVRHAVDPGFLPSLFQVRARSLLARADRRTGAAFLSGCVIGGEVADLCARNPHQPIVLAASAQFSPRYRLALEELGAGERLRVVPSREVETAVVRAHRRFLDF